MPGYRESRELLARVRQELTTPPKVEVPDVRGQTLSQAHSSLASKGLELSVYEEVSSDTIAEGEIIEQSPVPETEVLAGSSVSVTLRIAAAFLVFRPIETALERALSK